MKTTILTACNNSVEAKLIQGNLANEGIESILSNENFTSLYPNMNGAMGGGVRVLVYEDDLEKALAVINSNVRTVTCPRCHSDDVSQQVSGKHILKNVGVLILSLFSSSAFGNSDAGYKCNVCENEFKI